ncbi:MAG: hypothetical protein AABZ74_18705 [Cyanobacteriota bacterium]
MSGSINGGSYLGSGLGSFDLKVEKGAVAGNQKASDAINTGKNNKGAEIISIDAEGNAQVHKASIKEGTFTKPKATASGLITVDNLSTTAKTDKTKPLAIDSNIASVFGAKVAILSDEKSGTAVIGQNKQTVAAEYLSNPTAKKVDAAYIVAGDDNFVNKKLSSNVTNQLSANYRNLPSASSSVSLLKDGQAKTAMTGLIAELNILDKSTTGLEGQVKDRNGKYNTDIAKPQERLNNANQAWSKANDNESSKVDQASEALRETQFPGVHDTEKALGNAKQMVSDGKGYLQNAVANTSKAEGEVNRLENIKERGQALGIENKQLANDNRQIGNNMLSYMVNRADQLNNFKMTLNNKADYFDSLANQESKKQPAPSGAVTNDPFAGGGSQPKPSNGGVNSDPFAGGGKPKPANGGVNSDPFAGGGNQPKPSNGGINSDPFAGGGSKPAGDFRNDGLLQEYRTKARETRGDAMTIDMRVKGLNQAINAARTSGIDSNSFVRSFEALDSGKYNSYEYVFDSKDRDYFSDPSSDKSVIKNNFLAPISQNLDKIDRNNNTIRNSANEYNGNIGNANKNLQDAKVAESQASGNLSGAQSSVTQYTSELQRINGRPPQADSNPDVKAAKTALDKTVKHKDATVGDNAPLTKEKTTSQGVVDQINGDFKKDISDLNSKISDNSNSAQQKINAAKKTIGI